ncbi:MAG TPA: hypothetical protein VFE50_20440 [Cyclobacteriaceae bacterium]|nr:hypothetical protein [Cyclobacteriaceae bacterium]
MKLTCFILLLFLLATPAFSQRKKSSPKPKPTIAHADSLFLAGNLKDAIPVFDAVLKDPSITKDARAWFRSARAYSSANDLNKSVISLDSAITKGFVNYKLMDSDAALANLRKDSRYEALRERALNFAYPCRTLPEAKQFDFWLGEWDVHPTANMSALAGYNKITRAAEGCLIVESWTSAGPHSGMSLNYYDPATRLWNQKWVGSGQDIQEFTDGVYADNMMRFKFVGRNPDGTTFQGRLTFTNMNGKVRQHSERTNDNGSTWQTIYDFTYVRKAAGEMP